jgi:ABC-type transport system involved in multi-copper enzyme maturation permease subunit
MTTCIFLKELQNHLLNRSILFTWGVIIVLFVLNASIYVFQYQDIHRNYENNVAKNYRNLVYDEEQNLNTLPSMVNLQQAIHNRPSSLSFISSTAEGIVPDGVSMKMFEEPDFENFAQSNPHTSLHLSIDWSTLMIYVISFLCICFSYNAFSGEREDGTMKLMLANSLSRSSIIFAKYFGLLVVFLIPIFTGILISCLIFEISPAIHLELADYAKMGWYFLASVLIVSQTILLGFFVSSLTRNSYISLIVCLLCWTLLAIIIPNISWIISGQFNKIPTVTTIYQEEEQQQNALKDCYMGWQGNNSTEQTALDRKDCIDRRTVIHNGLWSDYHNRQMEQTNQAIQLSKISPFGLFRFLGDKISGNNFYGYIHFFGQVKNYQLTYRNYVIDKDNADLESRHIFWNEWQGFYETFMSRQPVIPDEVPQFIAQPQTFHQLVADTMGDIAILCFWVIGLFVLLFVSFIKHDIL